MSNIVNQFYRKQPNGLIQQKAVISTSLLHQNTDSLENALEFDSSKVVIISQDTT